MKNLILFAALLLLLPGCAVLNELTAFSKCEFSLYSMENPIIGGVEIGSKSEFTEFSFREGQVIVSHILRGTLPFTITVNVEARNPGTTTAAVNSIEWIAYVDEIQVASGMVNERVEVAPAGGRALIPVKVNTDLFDYLEGDNPRTMINFAMNLIGTGDQPTQLTMKIKPSVLVGGQDMVYPGYFKITKEFSSGN
jgi:LEA14-like dessication related protein